MGGKVQLASIYQLAEDWDFVLRREKGREGIDKTGK
jgi:hypothetical protein